MCIEFNIYLFMERLKPFIAGPASHLYLGHFSRASTRKLPARSMRGAIPVKKNNNI